MAAEEPQNAGKVGVFQAQAADWLRCHVSGVPDDRQVLPTRPRPAARDLPLPCPSRLQVPWLGLGRPMRTTELQ